ncbi:hypothetical protein NQ317_002160 [Molorchus minor]|uniref:Uncharacterized protein n=1 Tax=Molorchus minor TaxID=1323400 RepID=A0ABQ9JNC9_9CUCU|nr:hypothetical protein NQ317_002160 [Molorchus minor]
MIFTCEFIFVALVGQAFSQYLFANNWNNLGETIRENVNRQLAPLKKLEGDPVGVQSVQDVVDRYSADDDVNTGRYNPNLDRLDLGLGNLGSQIQESVFQALEPVRAMEITFKMKDGVGGTTIATHLPGGKEIFIQNSQSFTCTNKILENGQCSGKLIPFRIKNNEDYCYDRKGFSLINNKVCIGATSVSVINNVITCQSNSKVPALLMDVSEYNRMCQNLAQSVRYTYIADPNNPEHIQIPNANRHVKCENNKIGVCVFTENNALPLTSGNVVINSGRTMNYNVPNYSY